MLAPIAEAAAFRLSLSLLPPPCSNASDALDKLRFLSVTDASLMDATQELDIKIKADQGAGTLTIT